MYGHKTCLIALEKGVRNDVITSSFAMQIFYELCADNT